MPTTEKLSFSWYFLWLTSLQIYCNWISIISRLFVLSGIHSVEVRSETGVGVEVSVKSRYYPYSLTVWNSNYFSTFRKNVLHIPLHAQLPLANQQLTSCSPIWYQCSIQPIVYILCYTHVSHSLISIFSLFFYKDKYFHSPFLWVNTNPINHYEICSEHCPYKVTPITINIYFHFN